MNRDDVIRELAVKILLNPTGETIWATLNEAINYGIQEAMDTVSIWHIPEPLSI